MQGPSQELSTQQKTDKFQLRQFKRINQAEFQIIEVEKFVVGRNAVSALSAAKAASTQKKTAWLISSPLYQHFIGPTWFRRKYSVKEDNSQYLQMDSEVRRKEIFDQLQQKYPWFIDEESFNQICEPFERQSLFYKDAQWREFNGRARSQQLKFGEEYFTLPGLRVDSQQLLKLLIQAAPSIETDIKEVFTDFLSLDILALGNEHFLKLRAVAESKGVQIFAGQILSIRKDEKWIVKTTDRKEFHCEEIEWPAPIDQFLAVLDRGSNISSEWLEFVESCKTGKSLECSFKLNLSKEERKKIQNSFLDDQQSASSLWNKTLLFPISQTHEQGHMIIEVDSSLNNIHILHYLEDEISQSEEELSRLVKNFRKNSEKIFSLNSHQLTEETVVFSENAARWSDDVLMGFNVSSLINENRFLFAGLSFGNNCNVSERDVFESFFSIGPLGEWFSHFEKE